MKFIVFGLGNYGASLSQKLMSLGHEVIGVDSRMEVVDRLKNNLTHTIAMDVASPDAVSSLPVHEVDVVVNAIGENEGANIMLTATLKQLQANRIICRVVTPLQKAVLDAMDITEFVYPEADSAERLAYKLDLKGVIDSYKITDEYQILELEVPDRHVDQTIEETKIWEKYNIQAIAILRESERRNIIGSITRVKQVVNILSGETVLRRGDRILLFGNVENLENFIED
jgi:trk system potassium uptake protein